MHETLRRLRTDDAGGTIFENSMLAVVVIVAAVTLLSQVEGSVRDVFRNSAIQSDTERQYNGR
jgi:Flp pilus assembly pilin Flp